MSGTHQEAARIVELLGLRPLPVEGGHWAQTWRDDHGSAIYYLLAAPEFSALHRLAHPEVFAYHAGAPARMFLVGPDRRVEEPVLGPDLAAGQRPQVVVPAGAWQATETLGAWTLLGTFMAPPYTDDAVEFAGAADLADLAARHPAHAERIRRLSRS
ncbi:cupin domain-containing protein [Streptoalloteichus tenebrarius]|uniref:cupin domain-containing protein n=1 Tax=Streptoalloteichus tenebrarius (strain ATCC 17920 / DSM 40477 / JCM 4838 / CBS 697.72 / NBRC 16177 / NCIMB 11028 / NRRL B-12390 / A12253. 1 / ISP 5477) TaxID=1933 RepID=UPI0020A3F124|nr:cupin domain-containing protein [Streptoalloteichus tenebrarius]